MSATPHFHVTETCFQGLPPTQTRDRSPATSAAQTEAGGVTFARRPIRSSAWKGPPPQRAAITK
jgi:hypothetical protein